MNCPIDDSSLVMSERNGIEIDYCPKCRGVWLDRGELDKIIDRSSMTTAKVEDASYQKYDSKQYSHKDQPYKKRKREGFLGELFDF